MTTCKRNHVGAGRHPSGTCRECQRVWQREYKARVRRTDALARAKIMHSTARGNAKRRGIDFYLSVEDVHRKLVVALRKGSVTLEMDHPNSPSLDRTNSGGGYTRRNVEVVPHWLNLACHDWDKHLVMRSIKQWQRRKAV